MSGRRIASIWLPRLPIERAARNGAASPEARVALVVEQAHGPVIHAATDAAIAAGARPGARLTDARALDPALQAIAADVAGDAVLLGRLARWASRWSPLVEVDGTDGIRLDTSGIAHLFGGEQALVRDMEQRFAFLGLTAKVAIAPTAAGAWALARCSGAWRAQDHDLKTLLAPLPVAALRLSAPLVRTLERLGLKTIGALVAVPRRSLARRFRDEVLDALDRATGRKADPLTATPDDSPPRALLRLAEPVADPEAAPRALALLMPDLVDQLEARRLGVRRMVLAGYRVDGDVQRASVATALPSRDADHLIRLLREKAQGLDPGFGFDAFVLEASHHEPLAPHQDGLVGGPPAGVEIARLVDRLSVRLGPGKICRPQPNASHLPERASLWRPALSPEKPAMAAPPMAPRPQRMLDRPEAIAVIYATPQGLPRRFVWRRAVHDVARAEGPERISPEWWRERSTARLRDYYRVEDRQGRRYWIYREGLHGDGRGGDPAWYMHGLFG